MRPTQAILGASRLPLTPKRGNKDFYKGTRQSYVPGGGHRTGPPGKHVVQGKAKFRIVDEQVRIFVAPPQGALASTNLKPYISTKLPNRRTLQIDPDTGVHLPSFSPNAIASTSRASLHKAAYDSILSFDPASVAAGTSAPTPSISPAVAEAIGKPGKPTPSDFRAFSKRWSRASKDEKQALTMEHRRQWWEAMVQRYPATQVESA